MLRTSTLLLNDRDDPGDPANETSSGGRQRHAFVQDLSSDDLYDHVIQVLPNLRAVAAAPAFRGPSWRLKRADHGIQMHEYNAYASRSHAGRPRAMSDADALQQPPRWPWTRMPSASGRLHVSRAMSVLPPILATPPPHTAAWPNATSGVPFAAVAHCELSCHVSEAVEALFSTDGTRHDATMRALWGAKFRGGDQLRAELVARRSDNPSNDDSSSSNYDYDYGSVSGSVSGSGVTTPTNHNNANPQAAPQQAGWLGVHTTLVAPKHDLHLSATTKHSHAQHLGFTMYSHRATRANEAFVVLKTLPTRVHEHLVAPSERSALRGAIDHIAVGYHLTGHYSDTKGPQTRLVMCAYVSTVSGAERPEVVQWRVGLRAAHDRANADAKYIVRLLALAACDFERVVRRRRFGLQPFIMPTVDHRLRSGGATHCAVCDKRFGLLRHRELCQLCGHAVCRRCSSKYEAEAVVIGGDSSYGGIGGGSGRGDGEVSKHRACCTCARRVEFSALQLSDTLSSTHKNARASWYATSIATERAVCASANDADMSDDDDSDTDMDTDADRYHQRKHQSSKQRFNRALVLPLESPKPGHQLAEALFSPHPLDRARALEVLKVAVQQVTTQPAAEWNKPLDPALVDKYLEARQRLSRISSKCSTPRDVNYSDGATEMLVDNTSPNNNNNSSSRAFPVFYQQQPTTLPRSQRGFAASPRVTEVSNSRSTTSSDADGLDAICEVAAQRMRCPMAFVSVLGRDEQHVVGTFQVPECIYKLPRNQSIRSCGSLVANEPLVVLHPMQHVWLRTLPLIQDARVRFFASFPITDRHGAVMASICTIDTLPRDAVSRDELAAMDALTTLAADTFDKCATPVSSTPHARRF